MAEWPVDNHIIYKDIWKSLTTWLGKWLAHFWRFYQFLPVKPPGCSTDLKGLLEPCSWLFDGFPLVEDKAFALGRVGQIKCYDTTSETLHQESRIWCRRTKYISRLSYLRKVKFPKILAHFPQPSLSPPNDFGSNYFASTFQITISSLDGAPISGQSFPVASQGSLWILVMTIDHFH